MITVLKFDSHDDFLKLDLIYYHDGCINYMIINASNHLRIVYEYQSTDKVWFSCTLDIIFDDSAFLEGVDSIEQFNTFAQNWFVEVWDMDYEKDKKIIKFLIGFFETYPFSYTKVIYVIFTLRPIQVSWTQTPIDNPYS
jgi:hypothetical protein